jgi:hypothetical protein
MTDPGSGAHSSGSQPGTPDGAWAPPAGPPLGQAATADAGWAPQQEAPAKKKGLKKVLPIVGSVVAACVIGGGALGLGFGDPEVGDCVQMKGETDFDVVDCGTSEAEYKIVGIEDKKQTYPDFMADENVCSGFAQAEMALWTGADTEEGTAYCAEAV